MFFCSEAAAAIAYDISGTADTELIEELLQVYGNIYRMSKSMTVSKACAR